MHFGLFTRKKQTTEKSSAKNAATKTARATGGKLGNPVRCEMLETRRYLAIDSIPYTGSPTEMPAFFQAVNYDLGGEAVAYHENSTVNFDGFYRPREAPDIIKNSEPLGTGLPGSGYSIANTHAGEYLKYTVDVPTTGAYNFAFRVASKKSGGVFHLEVDGNDATGFLFVPKTGSGGKYKTVKAAANVPLSQGTHIFKLVFDVNGVSGTVGNVNWILCNYGTDQTPATPNQFKVTANPDGSQTLSFVDYWPINTYVIQRTQLGLDSQWSTINVLPAPSPQVTGAPVTWTDTSAVSGNTYFYRVYAANGSGRSAPTSPTSISSTGGGSSALTLADGSFLRVSASPFTPGVTKFTPSGLVDTTFGTNGTLVLDSDQQNYKLDLFQLSNGNVLINEVTINIDSTTAVTSEASNLIVIAPTGAGSVVQNINTGFLHIDPKNKVGGNSGTVYNRAAVYSNGTVVLAGFTIAAAGYTTAAVERLTSSLTPDVTFGGNGVDAVGGYGDPDSIVLLGDGRTALIFSNSVLFLNFNGSLGSNFSWNLAG